MAASVVDAYTTPAVYRDRIAKTDSGSDAAIAANLLAISRWIDLKLGRFFTKDAAPVARVFSVPGSLRYTTLLPANWAEQENPYRFGNWARHIATDDMAAPPTSVVIDVAQSGNFTNQPALNGTALGGPGMYQDYELWPQNAALGPEPKPWRMVVIPTRSASIGFLAGQRVQVTAQWGWPAIPAAIVDATIQLTAILRLESPRATTRVDEIGTVIGTSKAAQGIVNELHERYVREDSII